MRGGRLCAACIALMSCSAVGAAQQKPATVQLVPAELAGVVSDTAGNLLRDVEIIIPTIGRSARSGADGRFLLAGIIPGAHEVWIRRIGYISVPLDWYGDEGRRVELSVTLRALPNTLDPVRIWATEGKSFKSTSMVSGIVVDSAGLPVPNADLQLIGTSRSTKTSADGSFEFRHVLPGMMTLRTRHLGYAPVTLTIELENDDQRAVTLRVSRLAQSLDTVRVTEASGYGRSNSAWEDFDRRARWLGAYGDAKIIGPKRFAEAGQMPLDLLLKGYAVPPHSRPFAPKSRGVPPMPIPGSACVLENGAVARLVPLDQYTADQVDRIEYYPPAPPEQDYTHTVANRLGIYPQCAMDPANFSHPSYWVIWLKSQR
jgi:hypothetical protein